MARSKDPELESLWRQGVWQHSTRGLSITEFCLREAVLCSSFYDWKRWLGAGSRSTPRPSPLFVSVLLEDQPREKLSLGCARL